LDSWGGKAGEHDFVGADAYARKLVQAFGAQVFDVIEDHVDHGRLIDHEQITVEWIFFVLPEASRLGVDLKKPMDRLGLVSGCHGHAFGRTSGRRAQEEQTFFAARMRRMEFTRVVLSTPGPRAQRGVDRRLLTVG
jgi:hypothetical protein